MSRPAAPGSKPRKGNALYWPLAEALARPRMRALRRLRFFDWCSFDELMVACEVSEEPTARATFLSGLSYAVKKGEIERLDSQPWQRYRVTAKGLAAIAELHDAYDRNLAPQRCAA